MKVAEHSPVHCTACYGQYPDRQHIDFETSYDGPVIQGGVMGDDGQIRNTIPVSIDELVICESCMEAAAKMLGMSRKNHEKLKALEERVQAAEERALGLEVHNEKLNTALQSKPGRARVVA